MLFRSNTGYYIPFGRDFLKSHTLTTATFSGTGIKEANIPNVGAFVDNLLDTSQPVMRAYETQRTVQNAEGIALFSIISNALYALLGL